MRRLLPLTAASLLLACSTPAPKPAAKPAEQPQPAPQAAEPPAAPALPPGPQLIINGQPSVMTSALAYTTGSSEVYVELSDAATSCEEHSPNGRGLEEGKKYVTLAFAPVLQPDGTRRWMATRLAWGPRNLTPGFEPERFNGLTITPPADGQPVVVKMDYAVDLEANDFLSLPAERLELRGDVSAPSCGVIARDVPNAITQDKLTATHAGQPLIFQGAILTGSPDSPRLELTTSPRDCDSWRSNDLMLRIDVKPQDNKNFIHTTGDLLLVQQNDSAQLNIKQDKKDPTKLTIDGTYNVADQPLVLRGAIKALNCMK